MNHRLTIPASAIPASAIAAAVLLACASFAASAAETATAAPAGATAQASDVKLFIATNGVALSQFPSTSRLSTTVKIDLTRPGVTLPWLARSDSAWLTVTSSGATGTALKLQADPSSLAEDTLYIANVVVATPASSSVQDTERMRVSFWKGSTDPDVVEVAQNVASMAANPVEPLAYVSDGGQTIQVYNVYSGALVRTLDKVAPSVGRLVVSSDGTKLFTVDRTNYRLLALDARSGKLLQRIRLQGPIASDFSFAYARPAGNETLYAPGQPAIDVASGQAVSAPIQSPYGYFNDPYIAASADGTRLTVLERNAGFYPSLDTLSVSAADGQLSVTPLLWGMGINSNGYCASVATTSDSSRLYAGCGLAEFDTYDWRTAQQIQTLPANYNAVSTAVDSNGDLVGAIDNPYFSDASDVYVYNRQGYTLGTVPASNSTFQSGQAPGQLATSGDSMRVITTTDPAYSFGTQTLVFRSLPHGTP
ncbi:MAG: hypothetical protein JSR59_18500 [Proteobacteria bacterium]|nr:hypothetical protein [Pseudomonadota bacterium]